jgi:atypical dual specificity phosphatase
MSRVGIFGQISEINDHLFLSGAGVLRPEKLKQKGINCIINATIEEPTTNLSGIDCVRIRIEDSPFSRLDNYFDLAADKIRSIRERGGKTLVHCVAGVSRSATLCIVYLIKYERMSLRQAYHYVKSARPIVRPNLGFWQQMVDYERKLRGHSTVTMIPVEGSAFAFPDVYSQDLRKHILTNPGPPQHDSSLIALQKRLREREQQRENSNTAAAARATLIPIQLINTTNGGNNNNLNSSSLASRLSSSNLRRNIGGLDSSFRHRHSSSALPMRSTTQNNSSTNSINSTLPWHVSSLLSPAPGRRSAAAGFSSNGNSRGETGLFGIPSIFQQAF